MNSCPGGFEPGTRAPLVSRRPASSEPFRAGMDRQSRPAGDLREEAPDTRGSVRRPRTRGYVDRDDLRTGPWKTVLLFL